MTNHLTRERCDGHTRRDVLRVGGLTALGLGLPDLLRLQRRSLGGGQRVTPKARRCVLIWLDGGPSHLETFDPKPDAPLEVRGPLTSIQTAVPGVSISECLPETARRLNHVALLRSVTSPLGEHNFGTHYLMTGYKPTPVIEYPTFGAVLAHQQQTMSAALEQGMRPVEAGGTSGSSAIPANVAVPDFRVGGGRMTGGGFLPIEAHPFSIQSDPSKPDFRVRDLSLFPGMDLTRLDRRRAFLRQLDRFARHLDESTEVPADPEFVQAFRLTTSPEARRAFDLSEEADETRNRYGRKTVGQGCLLARRLLERGVPFVTVNHRGWDTHAELYTRLKEGFTGARTPVGLVPSLDLALSALLDDLAERGLLDETLIVVMGEFGRTPKLNTQGGRDHWPRVFSAALAGGGVGGGQVVGASDAVGESPAERPVTPADITATIYTLLGIDPTLELHTPDGRPVRLTPPEAAGIREVLT